eukprot:4492241-Amphidinium_carterae.3
MYHAKVTCRSNLHHAGHSDNWPPNPCKNRTLQVAVSHAQVTRHDSTSGTEVELTAVARASGCNGVAS